MWQACFFAVVMGKMSLREMVELLLFREAERSWWRSERFASLMCFHGHLVTYLLVILFLRLNCLVSGLLFCGLALNFNTMKLTARKYL